ncbi:DUF1127 domain-containing protein [Sinorhizobium sp. BG8]|uniref:DUF1127 domain-containing protein n=1 Tax=Sinorhizobium sp. BG8 TaxID=2613773 RepID=UPI00193C954C|nr:DUF1127 domain-containing protein [Sinorhizobium sp. BG8]QRM53325.1 DUF1127 domain-containing protein [Sinorhizobium sp. BG8]
MTADIENAPALGHRGQRLFAKWMARLADGFARHLWKRRSRRALSEMSDDQLNDIGITRAEARREAERSWFWD